MSLHSSPRFPRHGFAPATAFAMSSNSTSNPLGNITDYEGALVVAALPTLAMLLGSALVLTCQPTAIAQACLQNLSAGIILAVRGEQQHSSSCRSGKSLRASDHHPTRPVRRSLSFSIAFSPCLVPSSPVTPGPFPDARCMCAIITTRTVCTGDRR